MVINALSFPVHCYFVCYTFCALFSLGRRHSLYFSVIYRIPPCAYLSKAYAPLPTMFQRPQEVVGLHPSASLLTIIAVNIISRSLALHCLCSEEESLPCLRTNLVDDISLLLGILCKAGSR